jgi:hypothetical protein
MYVCLEYYTNSILYMGFMYMYIFRIIVHMVLST